MEKKALQLRKGGESGLALLRSLENVQTYLLSCLHLKAPEGGPREENQQELGPARPSAHLLPTPAVQHACLPALPQPSRGAWKLQAWELS